MRSEVPEALRPTLRAAVMLALVFAFGTAGYRLLAGPDQGWLDALYMTTITLTTVGYEEAIPVAGRPVGEVFTVLLLVGGAGTFVYFFSNLTAFLVEGTLQQLFWRRNMTRLIQGLEDHHVVCGGGRSGEVVVCELLETGRPFVLIEQDEDRARELRERVEREFPMVIGDATEDEVLAEAGLERARSLVSCIGSDKDNVLVVFTARNLNPGARIVARCLEPAHEHKLRRAGADAVVSPDRIGGLRLVSETIRPTAVSFLDVMLRDREAGWRVEEVTVGAGSSLADETVGGLRARNIENLLLMAIRHGDDGWVFNPDDATALAAGTGLVFLCSPAARSALEQAATG